MRQHKYRIWNKTDKVMISLPNSPRMVNGELVCDDDDILLEYIGTEDHNGVEIFEGDVVYIAGIGDCVVRWADWYLGFVFYSESEEHELFSVIEDIGEIRGNIHESPELAV